MPADRLVSDPRLCASVLQVMAAYGISKMRSLTPRNCEANCHPSPGRYTDTTEIPHMDVRGDYE